MTDDAPSKPVSGQLSPTRIATVDNRKIVVVDDTVPEGELSILNASLEVGRYRRTEYARLDTMDHKHWVIEPVNPETAAPTVIDVTKQAVEQFFGEGYQLFRAYCNVALYGDLLLTHTDCGPDEDLITALWYAMDEWDVEWGGETMFYDKNNEAAHCVTPKPGRLVVFHGAIPHVGRPPNRNCYVARYTLALKYQKAPPAQKL